MSAPSCSLPLVRDLLRSLASSSSTPEERRSSLSVLVTAAASIQTGGQGRGGDFAQEVGLDEDGVALLFGLMRSQEKEEADGASRVVLALTEQMNPVEAATL